MRADNGWWHALTLNMSGCTVRCFGLQPPDVGQSINGVRSVALALRCWVPMRYHRARNKEKYQKCFSYQLRLGQQFANFIMLKANRCQPGQTKETQCLRCPQKMSNANSCCAQGTSVTLDISQGVLSRFCYQLGIKYHASLLLLFASTYLALDSVAP